MNDFSDGLNPSISTFARQNQETERLAGFGFTRRDAL